MFCTTLIIIASLVCVQGILQGIHEDITQNNGHTAAILRYYWDTARFQHYCTGAIVSELYVLTTASCSGDQFTNVGVRVGSTYRDTGGSLYRVDNVYRHPKFTPDFDYDIALLKLSNALKFSHRVFPVKLPNQNDSLNDGQEVKTSGWGYTSINDVSSNYLIVGYLRIYNSESCNMNFYPVTGKLMVTDNMMCADGGGRPCERDQGAPLVLAGPPSTAGTLVGLFSWNFGCASTQYAPVFTRVSAFRTWIDLYVK